MQGTQAAQALADHAILFLALGIIAVGLAMGAAYMAARVARRFQTPLLALGSRFFSLVRRVPVVGRVIAGARVALPTSYVAVHLALGLIATAAALAFLIVAEEVFTGSTVASFDRALASALQTSASPAWRRIFGAVTWFGKSEVLLVASVLVAVRLLMMRAYVLAIGWIIAQAGGALLNNTLNGSFARSRPESVVALQHATSSFPSGHAMGTFVFCGVGASILLRYVRSWSMGAVVITAAFSWCLVMGFTRLYLGVHYLSDVVAGLIAATAWVAVCISGIELALRKKR